MSNVSNYKGDPKDPTDDTLFDALQSSTMKNAGIAYLVGDASLAAAGILKFTKDSAKKSHWTPNWKEATTGAAWGIAGIFPAFFGNPKAEKQLELLSHHLGEHLRKNGVEIPKDPTTEMLAKPQGVIDHIESFLYTYPSQMLNAVYAVGSTTLIKDKNIGNRISGWFVLGGALAGLLIPEKKIDPEHPPTTTVGKAVAWLQEKPLRISSGFYWANNVGLLKSARVDKHNNPDSKNHWFKYLTVATYVFGNYMLACSSKDDNALGGKNKHEAMEKLAVGAAHIIAAQPKEVQEALIKDMSEFLVNDPQAQMTAAEINDLLHAKLKETTQGVTVPAGKWVKQTTASNETSPSVSF